MRGWMRVAAIAAILSIGLLAPVLVGLGAVKAGVSLAGCFVGDGD